MVNKSWLKPIFPFYLHLQPASSLRAKDSLQNSKDKGIKAAIKSSERKKMASVFLSEYVFIPFSQLDKTI